MAPRLHVLTPFSRLEYLEPLRRNLAQADSWTAIVTAEQEARFRDAMPGLLATVGPLAKDSDICYAKMNAWISTRSGEIRDDDYYLFLCDDDAIPEGLADRIRARTEEILVLSCKRGHCPPADPPHHPTWPLRAAPENMKTCFCTWEQAVVKGAVLKTIRFNEKSSCADGEMMEWLHATYGPRIAYVPQWSILFNRLQPGRWIPRS